MPDDPLITEMDPVHKLWMMNNWAKDQNDKVELAKNHAYLLGSFINPEAVKSLLDSNDHISDDIDFNKATAGLLSGKFDDKKKDDKDNKKRKRRIKE